MADTGRVAAAMGADETVDRTGGIWVGDEDKEAAGATVFAL